VGNFIERHVQIQPGPVDDGTARFTIVGGVGSNEVDLVSGLTAPGAVLGSSTLLPDDCPFAGMVELHGLNDPALLGSTYRIRATNIDSGGSQILTSSFWVVNGNGDSVLLTPDADGWLPWPTFQTNITALLANPTPGGNDRWDYTLELDTPFNVVDTARVQMDNMVNNEALVGDTTNAGDLELQTAGQCKVPHGPVNGTFVARDLHFSSWSISVTGGPGGPIPPIPLTVGIGAGTQTPFAGTPFTLDFGDPMIAPCGYVVRLTINDRAIVNSDSLSHHTTVERGICLE